MVKYKTMDANEAVSRVAYLFSEVCGIYPITPASPMAEHVDEYASHEKKNFFETITSICCATAVVRPDWLHPKNKKSGRR